MQIRILHESMHYVMIEAPMLESGQPPTRESFLGILETLRKEHRLRFVQMHTQLHVSPALICERIGPWQE